MSDLVTSLVSILIYISAYLGIVRKELKGKVKIAFDFYILATSIVLLFINDNETFNVVIIILIFILTYVGIIHTKIDKTMAAVIGAVFSVMILLIRTAELNNVPIIEDDLLHYRDLKIIALIIGTLILVDVSQESGVFHFISIKILKASKGDPKKLLRYFGVLTLVLSALVNNISAIMIVGSLTLIAAERLELDPKPYLITELSMTTVGGTVTLISSVPNIIIAESFNITFVQFLIYGAPFSIFLMFVNFIVFEYIFRNKLKATMDPAELERRVNEFDEWGSVTDKSFFYKSIAVLTGTILAFLFSEQIGLSLSVIAVAGGFTMVLISGKKIDEVMSKLDWSLIVFFLGLFVLITALEVVHVLEKIAEWLTNELPSSLFLSAIILLVFIAIISGIVDNIVVAAVFGPILAQIYMAGTPEADIIAWAAIFGANYGGGLTPIGSPSAVVGLALLYRKTGDKMGWLEFIKTQGIATIIRLILVAIYLAGIIYVL